MYPNICKHVHLPVQSGSDAVLAKMNRKYTRESYLRRVAKIREVLPDCSISTDIITGFCGESEEDHLETLSIMREVGYYTAYMFQYSERPNTKAARHYPDDVPAEVKSRRLSEVIQVHGEISLASNQKDLGKVFEVLVEGYSKRSKAELTGRSSQNKVVVFPAGDHKVGDYVNVKIERCTPATLIGTEII